MPYLSIIVTLLVVIVLAVVVSVVVTRLRNRHHLENMREAVEQSKYAEKKPLSKPKVMKGAQPNVGIKVLQRDEIAATSEAGTPPGAETTAGERGELAPPEQVPAEAAEPLFVPRPYPPFNNARAVEEFGLSQEEANSFIGELVSQIESELPALVAAVTALDMVRVEEAIHKLKGSTSNLGEGGMTDLLSDFNDYVKKGRDPDTLDEYVANLNYYLAELKKVVPS
ncbi:hypothetical protein [Sulfurimonas diazotrophicus]|uniref:HPt domain-containing protein n=1 Tax=Sulfurimonas diazotrophicus TaxID=3131939 RepID=A0ABZ3HCZ8_9BACT